MSELSNYIELLLRDDMPKAAKERLAEMIKEAELHLRPSIGLVTHAPMPAQGKLPQAPSTLAAMARHQNVEVHLPPTPPPPEPVAVIAQTPETAAAMEHRNKSISDALSGKVDKVSGRPRKW